MKKFIIISIVLCLGLVLFMMNINKKHAQEAEQRKQAYEAQQRQNELEAQQRAKERADRAAQEELEIARENETVKAQQDEANAKRADDLKKSNELKENQKKEVETYAHILQKWLNQDMIASSTARVSVATPLTEMRRIRDELDAKQFNSCINDAKQDLLEAMDAEIYYMINFMQQQPATSKKNVDLKAKFLNKTNDAFEAETNCKAKLGV